MRQREQQGESMADTGLRLDGEQPSLKVRTERIWQRD